MLVLGRVVIDPPSELGPARRDQGFRILGGHFDGTIRANDDVATRQGLHGRHIASGPQANPMAFRIPGVLLGLHLHPHALKIRLSSGRALEPVEELRRRINLIIMLPFSRLRPECLHLVSRFVRPEQE
jgi:hypothetical protein